MLLRWKRNRGTREIHEQKLAHQGKIWSVGSGHEIDDGFKPARVYDTPRIGVYSSGDWAGRPLRFCIDSPHLSRRLLIGTPLDPAMLR